jgi:hypothetical protein
VFQSQLPEQDYEVLEVNYLPIAGLGMDAEEA